MPRGQVSAAASMAVLAGDTAERLDMEYMDPALVGADFASSLAGKRYAEILPLNDVAIRYIDGNGEVKIKVMGYTPVSAETHTWSGDARDGWYVVNENITVTQGYIVEGHVKLILLDGCTLNVECSNRQAGIRVSGSDNSLTIYAGSSAEVVAGMGALEVKGGRWSAGIGGNKYEEGNNITINSGHVTAKSGWNGSGIGGGLYADGHDIIINGGYVTAEGLDGGAGIGGGIGGDGYNITISGGTVDAQGGTDYNGLMNAGGKGGAGIGSGCCTSDGPKVYSGCGSNIVITGGIVKATGGMRAAGIGNGYDGDPAAHDVTISKSLVVKAGDSADSMDVVTNDGHDIACALAGLRFVEITESSAAAA